MTIDVSTWDEVPVNNSTIDAVSIAENCSPGNLNNMGRAIMAGVKTFKLAYDAFVATAVTLTGLQTLTNKTLTSPTINTPAITTPTLTGTPIEDIYTVTDAAAFEIDPANGSVQLITLTASRTPKGTNFANGQAVTLHIDDGTAYTITWTDTTFGASGVKWLGASSGGGTAPTLATTGLTAVTLYKVGGQVYGSLAGYIG